MVLRFATLSVAFAQPHNNKGNRYDKEHFEVETEINKSQAAMPLLVMMMNTALAFHIFNTISPASKK